MTDPTPDHEQVGAGPHRDGDSPSAADRAMPPPAYEEWVERHEERLAERRRSSIEAGRRKGGAAGAAMAGAMLAVAEIYEGPPKEDAPVTVEASSDPTDVDRDGIDVTVGEVGLAAPPLERMDPVVGAQRRPPQV